MKKIDKRVNKSVKFIQKIYNKKCEIGIILGSGQGGIADSFENPVKIPYSKIPYFPVCAVKGHSGSLILANIFNLHVVIMKGRVHYYEGYSLARVTYPVRIMKGLGVKKLIIINAAGGINRSFKTNDIMVILDHINLMGDNPLRGLMRDDPAHRFIDMTSAYSSQMISALKKTAIKNKIKIQKGVYAGLMGPSYETPAEVRMLEKIGVDAVGMSTVPEVIVAIQLQMEVLGVSLITNMAAGILKTRLDHKEVLESSKKAEGKLISLIKVVLK